MKNIKVVCLNQFTAKLMTEKLNEEAKKYQFASILLDDIEKENKNTDLFILGAPYTRNIVDVIKGKVGSQKLLCLDKHLFKVTNIEEISELVQEAL